MKTYIYSGIMSFLFALSAIFFFVLMRQGINRLGTDLALGFTIVSVILCRFYYLEFQKEYDKEATKKPFFSIKPEKGKRTSKARSEIGRAHV